MDSADPLTLQQVVFAVAGVFAGATVLSAVGFGIGMVGLPISLIALDSQTAVMVSNGGAALLTVLVIRDNLAYLRARDAIPLAIAGLTGAIAGAFILSSSDDTALRISIVVAIMALTAATALNVRRSIPQSHIVVPLIGFVAALMLGALGIGAPILVLFMLILGWRRHKIRGMLSVFLLLAMLTAVAGYAVTGLYTSDRLILSASVVVPVFVGFWLGSRIARVMSERVFRQAAIAVIMVTSVIVLVREIAELI